MKDRISVIVPVYNVAQYLPQCMDSILQQDHQDLEVILIDDGSTDDSGAICDGYAARDSRVHVIHQKNSGAAAAKNAGLRVASGEYLSFVDSDDYLEPQVYGRMLSVLKEAQADIAVFSYRDVYRSRAQERHMNDGGAVMDGETYLFRFLKDWTCSLLWNKLYRREVFAGIFFEEGHKIDDEYFTYRGVMNARKVILEDIVMYNYRRRASSVMNDPAAAYRRIIERIDAYNRRRIAVGARFPALREAFDYQYMEALVYTTWDSDNNAAVIRYLRQQMGAYFREKGRTLPPRYLWLGMLRLKFQSTKGLLKRLKKVTSIECPEDYFP